jgi:hypothetical protein
MECYVVPTRSGGVGESIQPAMDARPMKPFMNQISFIAKSVIYFSVQPVRRNMTVQQK